MLSPRGATTRAQVLQLLKPADPRAHALQQEKPPQWETRTPQLESRPHSLQLEKACVQQPRPSAAKYKTEKKERIG